MTHLTDLLTAGEPLRAAALFLAAWWIKGALVLALGWLAARLLVRSSAAARHLAWALGVLAALGLPAASGLVPALDVSVPGLQADRLPAAEPIEAGSSETPVAATAGTATREAPEPASGRASAAPPLAVSTAGPSAGSTTPPPVPRWLLQQVDWIGLGFSLWLTGAVLLLLRSAAGRLARRRVLRAAAPAPADWLDLVEEAPRGLRVRRRLRLRVSPDAAVPMTWGVLRPVVVLPAEARSWTGPRLRDALFHELAHVRRLDVLTQSAAELLTALAWIDPLAWIARRRLGREAEHASDDAILAAGVRPSLYAGHLLEAARGLRGRRAPVPAPAAVAMARSSGLSGRIGAVLDEGRRRSPVPSGRAALSAAAALLLCLPLAALAPLPPTPPAPPTPPTPPTPRAAPAPPAAPAALQAPTPPAPPAAPSPPTPPAPPPDLVATAAFDGTASLSNTYDEPTEGYFTQARFRGRCEPGLLTGRSYGSKVNAHDDHWTIDLFHGSCSLEMELEGEIRFTADDRGIDWMGRGAEITIEEEAGDSTRALEVTPGPNGEPRYRWRVDGDVRPFDAEARRWLAGVLPEVFRTTGLQAEERVARLLGSGGVTAVLGEIRLMSSDHVQGLYFAETMDQARLGAGEAGAVLDAAGETLGSDHALAEILSRFPSEALADRGVQAAFVRAASTLGSDHEAGRVLRALLRRGDLAPETLDAILEVTEGIGSDHELTEVLLAALDAYPRSRPLSRAVFAAAATIGSDHEHGRLLRAVVDRGRLDDATVEALLRSARDIGSDHELAELLVHLARHADLEGPLRELYLETAEQGLGSRHARERALAAVGEEPSRGR